MGKQVGHNAFLFTSLIRFTETQPGCIARSRSRCRGRRRHLGNTSREMEENWYPNVDKGREPTTCGESSAIQ